MSNYLQKCIQKCIDILVGLVGVDRNACGGKEGTVFVSA